MSNKKKRIVIDMSIELEVSEELGENLLKDKRFLERFIIRNSFKNNTRVLKQEKIKEVK